MFSTIGYNIKINLIGWSFFFYYYYFLRIIACKWHESSRWDDMEISHVNLSIYLILYAMHQIILDNVLKKVLLDATIIQSTFESPWYSREKKKKKRLPYN